MNVTQLQPPPQPQLQRLSRDANEKEADFLALRLLNKRARLRLSPQPLDLDALPGKGRLFAVANRAGWFAAATRNSDGSYALVLSPLTDLRAVFSSSSSDGPLSIQPRVTLALPAAPHIVLFTQDDARLLVSFTNGALSVYDSHNLFQTSASAPALHTFPSPSGQAVRDILPSPGDVELVAVLRQPGDAPSVQILDVHKMAALGGWSSGGSPPTNPSSASWSPKGKQIAIGLESGDIVTFSPTDTSAVKTFVPRPQAVDGQSVISTTWLSNPEFHAIYVPAGQFSPDVEQSHYILSLDSKANTAGDVKLNSPYLPFPGLRPPGSFVIVLRNWEPSRLLLFVGDSTSSDIGLIGSFTDSSPLESWYNLTLEETSTPSVPLDADMNETVLLGLELDITNDKPYQYTGPSGEETDVPPPPIMYLYASDGTLTGWHIIQTQGLAYPGMAAASAAPVSTSPAIPTTPKSTFATPAAPATSPGQQSAFGSTTGTPGTGVGFGAFSGAPAAFGNTSFGFQTSPAQSLQAPSMSTPSMSVEMASASEDPMVSETDSGLGGMSLGGGGESSQPKSGAGTNSMFGSFGTQPQASPSTSPFGGGATASPTFAAFGAGPVKPPTGFGAFATSGPSAFGTSSSFGGGGAFSGGGAFGGGSSAFTSKPATDGDASKPTSTESKPASAFGQPAFGQSGFGAAAAKPAFGQSGFGQSPFGQSSFGKPAFGQSGFGSSSFGSSTTPTKPPATGAFGSSNGGGFAAFASAPTSFASAAQQATTDAKPAWASGSQPAEQKPAGTSSSHGGAFGGASATSKPDETKPSASPAGGAFAGLGQGSAFGKSSFGQSSFGQPSSGQSAFGQSAFGQSAFGKSAFGQPSTTASTSPGAPSTSSGGGFASFANAGPSAFGTAAVQKSPSNETKPVWASPSAEKPEDEEQQPKSAFSAAPATPSASGGPQSTATTERTASTTPVSSPEKAAAPVTPAATPPATPASKPAAPPAVSTTPATPAAGGAFGGLTTSTTGFSKLGTGFGAFGAFGSTTPTSSPFLQKSASTSQPSALFGQTSFGATKSDDKDSTTKPPSAFGTPSPLGQTSFFGKSAFGSSPSPFAKPAAQPSSAPATSAFSAFSSAPSPFAAAASGAKKSFGEMLREKEGEKTEETKPQGVSKTAEEWKKPVSVFASLKQAAEEKEEEEEDEVGNISFRSQDDDEDAEEGSEAGDDGIDDFLKSDEEEVSEDEEPEEEEVVQSQTPPESPTAKQPMSRKTPPSGSVGGLSKEVRTPERSPSPSPVPAVKIEPESPTSVSARETSTTPPGSPVPESPGPSPKGKGKAPARETSTTPPGSPVAAPPPPVTRATSAPPTSSPTPATGTGLLGLGRPSTRPTRSSPLANQPISGDDVSDEENEEEPEDEEEREGPSSSPKKARSASPAIPIAGAKGAAQQPTSRPKTPPLLFGGLGGPTKPPTPSPFSLSPTASPSLFASKPPVTPSEEPVEPTKPSSSAAAPSLKGPGTPGTPSIFGAPPVFTPPAAPQGTLFGQKPTAPSGGLFGQKPSAPTFGSPSLFSAASAAKPSSPAPLSGPPSAPASTPTPSFFGGSSFGTPGQPAKPSAFGGFGKPPAPPVVPPPSGLPGAPSQPQPPSQAAVAQGMQTECLYLFSTLAKELEDLKSLANRAKARAAQLNRPGTGNKNAQDLIDPTKWIMGDLPQFKQIMKEVERELEKWEKQKAVCISHIRELESDMLKATTRKEEIARFSKASQDAEFARMLKARTLSPEHLETQAQLRREIRTIRGRIQQLEDHIQASKKKLNSMKNGKPSLKPPSLDTINRTYRNIDLAIEQEETDVSALADRVAQLDLSANPQGMLSFSTTSSRDKRLPDRAERIGREVTPNIAASTAAALNAERSAQKLKRALLKARKEPLLNTKAVDALPPAREPRTSRKPLLAPGSGLGVGAAFFAGLNNGVPPAPALGFDPAVTSPTWIPPPPGSFGTSLPWSAPSSSYSDAGSPPGRIGAARGAKGKHHGPSPHTNQLPSVKAPPPPPPAGFSWGPVPKTEPKQMLAGFESLSKPKVEQREAKVKIEEKELGSSWVTEGFGSTRK
ncbi:hypothetical protein BV20DRAFT_972063 [Pilatotrama ljubarskyi]|nr:hypothetical protein BV20DRAFT_972063 [Pilatotrama ljubarskyi]